MSVLGQVEARVREIVGEALADLASKISGTDTRVDRVEERVSELEQRVEALENAAKPAAQRKTTPAVKAHAQTATGRGSAGSEK